MTASDAWAELRGALERAWRWARRGQHERRTAEARTRFWEDVRDGEREAEAGARPPQSRGPLEVAE